MKKTNDCKDLRYRLRKRGYTIIVKTKMVILPADDEMRSKRMEERIQHEFGYQIQYYML